MWMPSFKWLLQLHPHRIVRLVPVEYLQLWRGLFAGITLPEFNALLLRAKVGGQGINLRTWCYALLSHSPPQPQPNQFKISKSFLNCNQRPLIALKRRFWIMRKTEESAEFQEININRKELFVLFTFYITFWRNWAFFRNQLNAVIVKVDQFKTLQSVDHF